MLPLVNREIPIIADDYVEKDFGTGCVKITPSHDPNDFEMGIRHNLPQILVLDNEAKINENGGVYQGLDRIVAREKIVADLEAQGLLVKIEKLVHNVGCCYRCSTVVEPVTSLQWFVSMKPLSVDAIENVKNGEIRFVPERFSKTYLNWIENVRDWCISRQLWWGHRIPAFYCDDCGQTMVSKEEITVCPHCDGEIKHDKKIAEKETHICMVCNNVIDKSDNISEYEEKLEEQKMQLKSLEESLASVENILYLTEQELNKFLSEFENIEDKIKANSSSKLYNQQQERVNELREKKGALKKEIENLQTALGTSSNVNKKANTQIKINVLNYAIELLENRRFSESKNIYDRFNELMLNQLSV
jgi:uncharacterized Zn finger protein (UPF0148 family)